MKPVFIVGGSRTGSELLKNIIRKYSVIDFAPEMFMICPGWLHKDFVANASNLMDKRDKTYDINGVLDLIYSKNLYGYFWTTIHELDRSQLEKLIKQNGSTLKGIFESILVLHAIEKSKTIPGAKFPVHYSQAERLLEWFPDARIIHTTRDPRAIYVSQSNKYTKLSYSYVKNGWIRFKHFVHIVIQTLWTAQIHKNLSNNKNYYLFKYEDFLNKPHSCMKSLCDFLQIEYVSEMAEPEIYSNSSFNEKRGTRRSLQISSATSWKKCINPVTEKLISLFCNRAMKRFNYQR